MPGLFDDQGAPKAVGIGRVQGKGKARASDDMDPSPLGSAGTMLGFTPQKKKRYPPVSSNMTCWKMDHTKKVIVPVKSSII